MDTQAIPVLLTNPDSVVEAERLLTSSRIGCPTCIDYVGKFAPSHSKMYLMVDRQGRVAMTNAGCESNSLRFNPITHELTGDAHCTCESCF